MSKFSDEEKVRLHQRLMEEAEETTTVLSGQIALLVQIRDGTATEELWEALSRFITDADRLNAERPPSGTVQ